MSYSRRQLYAMGEPLGDGATRREVGGKVIYGSGGGGTSTPANTTQQVTQDLPEWARPYAKESLGKAAALSASPYQTYGGERVAQFTPLQKQAFDQAGNQQVAGQVGFGTGLAGLAGISSFGDQGTAASFMSPYMDAVVQQQMESAQRQADIAGTQRGAQAVRAGAFGGSRQAVENAEAARALASQKGQIQAQGLQSAFERAQQQFNQEQATRLNAAQTLGQLGQQQFGQQMDITGQQAQFGGQQRQATQDILSAQYQDFLNQQRAPYDQLAFMTSMIRGTPMGGTTAQYSTAPAPSQFSQLAGLGIAGAGAYGAYQGAQNRGGNAAGGEVKSYAAGGIASLNQPEMAAMAGGMSDQQLQQTQGLPSITELARMTLAAEAQQRAQMRQQAMAQQAMMQQQPQTTVAEEQMAALGGIGDLPAPNLENLGEGMAGGGIIAFQAGGPIRLPAGTPPQEVERVRMENPGQEVVVENAGLGALPLYTTPTGMTPEMAAASGVPAGVQEIMRQRRTLVGETGQQGIRAAEANLANVEKDIKEMGPIGAEREKRNLAQEKKLEGAEGKNFNMALIQAGLAIMAGNSANAFENIGKGAMVGTEAYTKGMERIQSRKEKLDESIARLDELRFSTTKADKAEVRSAVNNVNTAKTALGTSLSSLLGEEGKIAADAYASQETRKATSAAANKPTDMRSYVRDVELAAGGDKQAQIRVDAVNKYLPLVGSSGQRAATAQDQAQTAADRLASDNRAKALTQTAERVDSLVTQEGRDYVKLQKADKEANKISNAQPGDPNYKDTAGAFRKKIFDEALQNIKGTDTPSTAPAAAAGAGAGTAQSPLPMPANAASARVGMIYNTARGPARWDGSSFIPVQ